MPRGAAQPLRRELRELAPRDGRNGESVVMLTSESAYTQQVSKRLQVIMPDDEYQAVVAAARRRGEPVAKLVRDSLRRSVGQEAGQDADERIGTILRFARFAGPTGDISLLLAEIEHGHGVP